MKQTDEEQLRRVVGHLRHHLEKEVDVKLASALRAPNFEHHERGGRVLAPICAREDRVDALRVPERRSAWIGEPLIRAVTIASDWRMS